MATENRTTAKRIMVYVSPSLKLWAEWRGQTLGGMSAYLNGLVEDDIEGATPDELTRYRAYCVSMGHDEEASAIVGAIRDEHGHDGGGEA